MQPPFVYRFLLIGLASLLFFTACEKEKCSFPEENHEHGEIAMCLTLDPDVPGYLEELPADGLVADRAVGIKNKFWAPGQTIRVRFLGGSATLQNKVMAYAETWEQHANINFVKVTSGASEIRVAFGTDGHWSYIGKDNLNIPAADKTMNLQFTNATSEEEIRRVTLHEFGHALGLHHEHKSPLANIPWNAPAVYNYYAQFGWSTAQVDFNILNKLTWAESQLTNYDAQSIMHYAVSSSLTTNGYSVGWNTQLSTKDKEFIGKMYSSNRMRIRNTVNYDITFWLNGIYHTLKSGESLWVPAQTSGNQLSIWECPSACSWDSYYPAYGQKYKVITSGSSLNLALAVDY